MNKAILSSYPSSVAHEIAPLNFADVGGLLRDGCERFATQTAFSQADDTLSYGELGELGRRLAMYLTVDLALSAGDRVALMMPNVLSYPVSMCGVFWAGCVVVNVNPMYTSREVRHQILDSGARVMIVAEPFVNTVEQALEGISGIAVIIAPVAGHPKTDILTSMWGACTRLAVALSSASPFWSRPRDRSKTAVLQYTGGTTGPSKGAELLHHNLLSNVAQLSAWIANYTRESQEVVVTALPIYHIFAFTVNVLVFMRLGAKNILVPNPKNLPALAAIMKREGCSVITGVNTLFNGLLNTPGFEDLGFEKLKVCMGGGSAIQAAVARRWREVTGVPLVEGYGLSETSPVLTVNRFDQVDVRKGVGLPLPSTEISIRDDDGKEVAQGERGELCVSGPQVMRGYWNKPDENAKAFTDDGYFRTGDIAHQDAEGYFHIVDRKKDMVLVSGFNVYPNEIEAVCAEHPGVLESACVGVPDEKSGEAVKVFVVKRDPSLTDRSLMDHCRLNLAPYKVPRHVEFVEALPKSPVGKILRRELRV